MDLTNHPVNMMFCEHAHCQISFLLSFHCPGLENPQSEADPSSTVQDCTLILSPSGLENPLTQPLFFHPPPF